MRRSFRIQRRLAVLPAAAALAAAVVVLVGTGSASAGSAGSAGVKASSHTCLVMTGAGDPAFVKNFNPYTATGLPSGTFIQGSFYEPLIVTGEGGLKPVPWLARTWSWSNGNKTLTLNLAQNV
jgi:peptide/nickel transport system substrate-binding protein